MPERLVVVGGDAGGMAAVSQVRRLRPHLDIVALEKGSYTSYSACGIPYLVGGEVDRLEQLVARTPQQFRDKDRIDVRTRHEVMAVHLDEREVEVRAHDLGRTIRIGFDQLLLGTGGSPHRPPLPGIDLPLVHGVQHLDDAAHLLRHAVDLGGAARVVVVGGGYIGLEMAEAFVRRGAHVTLVDAGPQVLSGALDADMAALVTEAVRALGVTLHLGCRVHGFEPDGVVCDAGRVAAELVVLGIGTRPNTALAAAAGVALGAKGAVAVDRRQATNLPGVWAAGDCCDVLHLVSGQRDYLPLGTYANRQARVAGINIGGGYATFPGVLGTAVSGICGLEVARTGLTEVQAAAAGFGVVTSTIRSTTAAGYHPAAEAITVKLVVERGSGRVLGAQLVGGRGAGKRIDTCATAIQAGLAVDDWLHLDLAYAPPFSPVWDPVVVAAREALKRI